MAVNLLLAENISKAYGEKVLFSEITLGIAQGEKTALIARNGSGKTSLLEIITGRDMPDTGQVSYQNGLRLSYLEQDPRFPSQQRILDAIFHDANDHTRAFHAYQDALDKIHLQHSPAHEEELHHAIAQMDRLSAWDYEARVREVLGRFGIMDLEQSCGTLSGGQRKKVALARALLEPADLLVLDEPTNHLDMDMIEWMEEYLNREKLSLLVVTHDRYFLDKVCNDIVELDRGNLFRYKGGYTYYLEKKDERENSENKEIERARNLMRVELEWMRRSPVARTTKSKARIDSFYELEEKAGKTGPQKHASFQVKEQRIGNKILEINNIHKSYGNNPIITDFSYTFKKGERVGITGANGTGKTTLLKLIMGLETTDKGKITAGQTVVFGYFSQQGLEPEIDKRVIDLVKDIAEEIALENGSMSAGQFLYHFGFSKEMQYTPYSLLSGGEKRKLYLLMTLIANPNFLILDEPTNDLDIYTLNLLEDFLQQFKGCLVVVSHDRYFTDKLVDHLFIFEGEGKVKDFYGNYTAYRLQKQREVRAERMAERQKPAEEKARPVKERDPRKPTYKQITEYESLTKEIQDLETEKHLLTQRLSEPVITQEERITASIRIGVILEELETKEARWIQLAELIEG